MLTAVFLGPTQLSDPDVHAKSEYQFFFLYSHAAITSAAAATNFPFPQLTSCFVLLSVKTMPQNNNAFEMMFYCFVACPIWQIRVQITRILR